MRRKRFIFAAVLCLLFSKTVLAASFFSETDVINHVGIGDISIGLEEYETDEKGNEIPYENHKIIVPGQKIEKRVRIVNHACSAWIRAKIEYRSYEGIKGMSDHMIVPADEGWMKVGEYYYYTHPVKKDEFVNFIKEIRIPPEWDQSYGEKSFSVVVTADAVQEDNFTPDFSVEDPWFGTLIEMCVHTAYEPDERGTESFSVIYEGGAEGMIKTGDDFFSNWGRLMPGDTVSDKVQIKNAYSRPVAVCFWTETIAEDPLIEALQLEIKNGDEIIYSGSMGKELKEKKELAFLKPGEETELAYMVHVPKEINNRYALSETKTKWFFSAGLENFNDSGDAEYVPEKKHGDKNPESQKRSFSFQNESPVLFWDIIRDIPETVSRLPETIIQLPETVEKIVRELPKTGDSDVELYAALVMAASGLGAAVLWRQEKRRGNHE